MRRNTSTPDISCKLPLASEQKGAKWKWLQRLGIGGFLFFLAKGLLWLLVPSLLAHWCSS